MKDDFHVDMGGIALQNPLNILSSSNQFNNIANQDSCTFKSELSMTDFWIRNDVLINPISFHSHFHNLYRGNFIFKTFRKREKMYGEIIWHMNNREIYIQFKMYIYTTRGDINLTKK